jgi:uncharacterized membrane protein
MAKKVAVVLGAIFVIAGVWGFFSPTAVGFLVADMLSSIIHLIVGIVLLVVSGKSSVGNVLKTVGIVYVIFAILGFVQGDTVLFGAFITDMAANVFYLIVGLVLAGAGFAGKKDSAPMAPQM